MKYFFDTEFIEYPCTIDLISIGIVAEDGRELYLQSSEVDWSKADEWIIKNVKAHLHNTSISRLSMREEILEFVGDDPDPEFWAYVGAFDWVGLVWLIGRLLELPSNWPFRFEELKDLKKRAGNPMLPEQQGTEHLAIADARWNKEVYDFLIPLQPH